MFRFSKSNLMTMYMSFSMQLKWNSCKEIQFNMELLFQLRELVIKYLIWLD